MKKIILKVAIIIAAVITTIYVNKQINSYTIGQTSNKSFNSFVHEQEQKLWNTFEQHGILREEFNKQRQQKKINNTSKQPPLKPQIKQLLFSVAQDFDLDPTKLQVNTVNNGKCEAWVSNQTMMIDEPSFLQLTPNAQRFILAHEFQHLIYNDHADRYTLAALIDKKIKDEQLGNDLMNQFYRFQEERADILAALKNPDYAVAYQQCMQDYLTNFGEMDNPTHPKMSERVALATHIIDQFKSNNLMA